jgi:protein SCO1/2
MARTPHPATALLGIFLLLVLRASASVSAEEDLPATPPNAAVSPLRDVGIEQKLGSLVPAGLSFRDEDGKPVWLGDYFGRRPLVLSLVYLKCPGLCTLTLNAMEQSFKSLAGLSVGTDFDVLTVSFDPKETPDLAAAKKREYLRLYGRPGAEAGWHFLTGDAGSIRRLTDAVGFHYRWDNDQQQFIHPSGIMVLTPAGKVSQYLIGVDYPPQALERSLRAAGTERIGQADEQIVLYCFSRDPRTGKLALVVTRALRVGGILTMLGIGLLLFFMMRRHPAAVPGDGGEPSK